MQAISFYIYTQSDPCEKAYEYHQKNSTQKQKDDNQKELEYVMGSAGWQNNTTPEITLSSGDKSFCIKRTSTLIFASVVLNENEKFGWFILRSVNSYLETNNIYYPKSHSSKLTSLILDATEKFNQADKITIVKNKINETKQVMQGNIDDMLERGDKIEVLNNRAEQLSIRSKEFEKGTVTLKRTMACKEYKMKGIIALIIIVVILVIFGLIYSSTK